MAKVALVTGAGGFVGQALVIRLLNKGYTVRALDLPNNQNFTNFQSKLGKQYPNHFIPHYGNITNYNDIVPALENVSVIFHTAALLNSIASKEQFESVNVEGTRNVCEAASRAKIKRFLLVSTSDVFGIPAPREVITERTHYRSWGEPYADTKIKACNVVKEYSARGQLETTIIYPGWVYGPGDRQFFPAIIDMVKDKYAFTWHKSTPYCVDLVFIDDLITAIVNASESSLAVGEDFLILDNDTGITPEVFFRFIAAELNIKLNVLKLPYWLMYAIAWISQSLEQKGLAKSHLLSTTDVKAFGNSFLFSNQKAKDILDWTPSISSEKGLKLAFDWQQKAL